MKKQMDYLKETKRFVLKTFGGIALGCLVITVVSILLDVFKPFG